MIVHKREHCCDLVMLKQATIVLYFVSLECFVSASTPQLNGLGTLYVVATPIGNLDDISARALRVLAEVSLIAAEDTRHSTRLLQHFGIRTPLAACHEHN